MMLEANLGGVCAHRHEYLLHFSHVTPVHTDTNAYLNAKTHVKNMMNDDDEKEVDNNWNENGKHGK